MTRALDIVILGLSLSSSWGNGHATTYRGLLRALSRLGHRVTFLERDKPWYAGHRDLPQPDFCDLHLYAEVEALVRLHASTIANADAVMIGSYVPDGVAVIDLVATLRGRAFCFYDIDTPVTLAKLAAGHHEYLEPRQISSFDVYYSFTGGPTLTFLKERYGARRAAALYCSVDPDAYANTGEAPVWDLGYLGTYSMDRQPTLERLLLEPARRLPHRRFVVAGSQYPGDLRWPTNVEYIPHVPATDHASFYSRQRFTLNVTRADMIAAGWSPSVRLFEAAACGVPIISDVWNGIEDLFEPGEAIHLSSSADDVTALLEKDDEADRLRMAQVARKRVLEGHTAQVRAQHLAGELTALSQQLSRASA